MAIHCLHYWGCPDSTSGNEPVCQCRRHKETGSGRSPGEENGNPFQYSCLDNPLDRGAWWATVHKVAKSWTQLNWLSMHARICITTYCGKFFKRWEYQTTLYASWEICTQVKKQQLELDMEQQTGSKSGKEYVKAVYCHPAYLTYMQSTSLEMLDWMKNKLESRLLREISITSDMQMTPHLWQKVKKN